MIYHAACDRSSRKIPFHLWACLYSQFLRLWIFFDCLDFDYFWFQTILTKNVAKVGFEKKFQFIIVNVKEDRVKKFMWN